MINIFKIDFSYELLIKSLVNIFIILKEEYEEKI